MERPAKRLRTWKLEEPLTDSRPDSDQPVPSRRGHGEQQEQILPTRTIDISDFRRRAFHVSRRGGDASTRKRNGVMYLMPRAPIATVTANIIDVAVDNGAGATSVTQVVQSASDLVITVGNMGTLTIPGAGAVTDLAQSLASDLTGTSRSSQSGSVISGLPGTSSANGTTVASGDNTMTVTSHSTLTATYSNGTLIVSSHASTTQNSSSTQEIFDATRTSNDVLSHTSSAGHITSSSGHATTSSNTVTVVVTTPSPSATATDSGSGGGVTLSPQQQQVVGGVVGGVAGVALVLVALLYFLKWYRQRLKRIEHIPGQLAASRDVLQDGSDDRGDTSQALSRPQTTETQRSSIGPIAAIASRLKQLRPYSTNTVSTASTRDSLPSGSGEKSFQRMAGRKIPSVLSAGGDGYGGNYGVFDRSAHQRDESETSIYHGEFINARPFTRGQQSTLSEPSTPTRSDPFADPPSIERVSQNGRRSFSPTPNFSRPSTRRDFGSYNARSQNSLDQPMQFSPIVSPIDGFATLRPSPARTPVTQSPTISAVHIPEPSSTPPLMAGNVPDLPAVPALSLPPKSRPRGTGPRMNNTSAPQRNWTATGTGRSSSTGGRFTENID